MVIFHYPCLRNVYIQTLLVNVITNRSLRDNFRQIKAIAECFIPGKQNGFFVIYIGRIYMKLQ
ncbi:Uncharacterised protein [Shigella sonnei]|nr:Uncharacterised protein [Shigella sonnei]